jgi:ubiquinone/menaquinone biosynthesis C-methylase UbiE
MKKNRKQKNTGSFYDRIADVYDLSFKVNGYSRSLKNYLKKHMPPLPTNAKILDAGSGTGLLTTTLLKTVSHPIEITALDLSSSSLKKAQDAIKKHIGRLNKVHFMQGNVLSLPFEDNTFDMVMTSGALEYISLEKGLEEMARVLVPEGYLMLLPVHPSPASKVLEVMFRFKAHPPQKIKEKTKRYFKVVNHYRFPPIDPIGWTKTVVLAQKI